MTMVSLMQNGCPVCRMTPRDPQCGMLIFTPGHCPICDDTVDSPMVALPCGHLVCQDHFKQMGGELLAVASGQPSTDEPLQRRAPAAHRQVLPMSGTAFRLQERKSPHNVLCSSMKMWSPSSAGSDSWWRIIDLDGGGRYFRLQETKEPNNVLCSSMKMWSPHSAGRDSWWEVINFDGTCFRLREAKSPCNVLCSSMKMWDPDHAGSDSWWHVA